MMITPLTEIESLKLSNFFVSLKKKNGIKLNSQDATLHI